MSKAQNTVKTRVFIISDTHIDIDREEEDGGFQVKRGDLFSDSGAFRPPMPKADVLLHSGDVSVIGTIEEYRKALQMLKGMDAELKLVIAGNHDLSLHSSYYLNKKFKDTGDLSARYWAGRHYKAEYAEQAQQLWTGREAAEAGVTYLTEGLHSFKLKNGASFTVYASPWQPEFFDWAFNYPNNEDRWNPPELVTGDGIVPAPPERDPHPIPRGTKVDLMMTHGPPHMHLDAVSTGFRAGCPHLLKALSRVKPRLHCFGHIHEAWGAERVTWASESSSEQVKILGGTNEGQMGVDSQTQNVIRPQDKQVVDRRAAFLDISSGSREPLRYGEETLLINSCVVDLGYNVVNAGWLVDLDLPTNAFQPQRSVNL